MSDAEGHEAPVRPPSPNPSPSRGEGSSLRRDALGVGAITFFVVSAAGPLIAVAGGAPIGMLFGDGPGMPAAYLVTTAILAAFSVGYTAMARHVRSAGGFYAFAAEGLGPVAGGAAAMIALLAYNAMQIGIYGMFGHALAALLEPLTGQAIPWWIGAFAAMALVAVCGYRRIDISARILGVLVAGEYLSVLALDVLILKQGGAEGISTAPLAPPAFLTGSPAIGLLFCFASFIGFEATAIYAEEARRPERTVPLATYLSLLLIGLFYAFTTWCMVLGAGPSRLLPALKAAADPTRLLFDLSDRYAGRALTLLLSTLFVTSVFAGLLAFHNAAARYHYALGRDGLLPRVLARTHPRHQSPHVGSLAQTLAAFCVVAGFAAAGADPVLTLFNWLTNVGTLGVLALMALASFSAPVYFGRRPQLRSSLLASVVAPVVSGLALTAILVLAAANFGLLTGASKTLAVALPASVLVAGAVGALLGATRRVALREARR
jgi:amino acid transporter